MAISKLDNATIPFYLRTVLILSFAISGASCVIAGWHILRFSGAFPAWFPPIYAGALALIIAAACWYGYALILNSNQLLPLPIVTEWALLAGLPLLILATSSLHQFYPFRPDVLQRVHGIPLTVIGEGPRLSFYFLFTGLAFLTVLSLGILYRLGFRKSSISGYAICSLLLLLPT